MIRAETNLGAIARNLAVERVTYPAACGAAGPVARTRGALWVAKERQVVPAEVERGLVLLEQSQRTSKARRYVG